MTWCVTVVAMLGHRGSLQGDVPPAAGSAGCRADGSQLSSRDEIAIK